jgi:hypothetical protein
MLVKYSSIRRTKMRTIAIVLATFWVAGAAMADDSCTVQATAKNLHGAALNSFAKSAARIRPRCKNFTAPRKTWRPTRVWSAAVVRLELIKSDLHSTAPWDAE